MVFLRYSSLIVLILSSTYLYPKSFFPKFKKIRKKLQAVISHAKRQSGSQKPTIEQMLNSSVAVAIRKRTDEERALDELVSKRDSLHWVSNAGEIDKACRKLLESKGPIGRSVRPFLLKVIARKMKKKNDGVAAALHADKKSLDDIISDMVNLVAQCKKNRSSSQLKKRLQEELNKSLQLKNQLVSVIKNL